MSDRPNNQGGIVSDSERDDQAWSNASSADALNHHNEIAAKLAGVMELHTALIIDGVAGR